MSKYLNYSKADARQQFITSRYKAYDPKGVYKDIVTLTNDSKLRYEAKGWTFKRTTLSHWNS